MVADTKSFSSYSHLLSPLLLRSLADLGFSRPTLIQAHVIPLALGGGDILARARTGSGKTAAYAIPVVQKILIAKESLQTTRALILVPTRELAEQVTAYIKSLCTYCVGMSVVNASTTSDTTLQRTLLADKPDIVICTPARALALYQAKTLQTPHLESLVIDEADLILSYGHDEDIQRLLAGSSNSSEREGSATVAEAGASGSYLPKVYQTFLMSATMTEDVERLKGLLGLKNVAILKLQDGQDEAEHLSQYVVRCTPRDKFLLTFVILKLNLLPRIGKSAKCLIFVNSVERCFKLKLFLEQFGVKSCVLNGEMPGNTRYHTVQEFNKGVYDYIIATDESGGREDFDDGSDSEDEDEEDKVEDFTTTQREDPSKSTELELAASSSSLRKRKASPVDSSKSRKRSKPESSQTKFSQSSKQKSKSDKEYGVTRGIDFVDVACVLNFDLPSSSRSYTHRVGRTARAGRTGMALSFVVPSASVDIKDKDKDITQDDEVVFSKIESSQAARGSKVTIYNFDMKQVEGFRYRMEDALRSVTRTAVKEARIKELKEEVLRSERLKAHFEDNPLDLEYLRHDKPLHPTRIQPHMKHIPKYLLPKGAPGPVAGTTTVGVATTAEDGYEEKGTQGGFVPFRKNGNMRGRGNGRGRGGLNGGRGRGGKKKVDPLKKFGRR